MQKIKFLLDSACFIRHYPIHSMHRQLTRLMMWQIQKTALYAFTNASIVKDAQTTLQNATMVIRQGKIVAVGNNIAIPKDAVVIDCSGKYIYPAFIDIYSDYGIPAAEQRTTGGGGGFFPCTTDYFQYQRCLWLEPGH